MNPRQVLVLVAGVLLVGGLVWWLRAGQIGDTTLMNESLPERLLPDFAQQLDSVSSVTVKDSQAGIVTLALQDELWRVTEKLDYPADQSKVKSLLIDLSEAQPVETKTSNPEFYSRLGLRDIDDSDSQAHQIQFEGAASTVGVLVGKTTPRFGGSSYARNSEKAQSWLVTPSIKVSTELDEWLDKNVLDVAADDIQSVLLTHADGDTVEISKDAMFDSAFSLALPEGRVANTTAITTLARGLTGLAFEDVDKSTRFARNDYQQLSAIYRLFDGNVIEFTLFEPKNTEDSERLGHWFSATSRFDESLARAFVPQPSSTDSSQDENATLSLTSADISDRQEKAQRINRKLSGWVYKITPYRYESFDHTVDSLSTASE